MKTAPEFLIVGEGHYRLTAVELGLMFEIDRLHRDRHDLVGELTVYCDWPSARTDEGVLSWGRFNPGRRPRSPAPCLRSAWA